MAGFSERWSRAKETLKYYLGGLFQLLHQKDIFLWAQAIAFKVLVTIVPMVILITGILGQILRGESAFAAVSRFIRDFLPPTQSRQVIAFLEQFQNASGTLTFIGATALFLSAMTLFSTLRAVLANVFKEEWHDQRSILRGYLFDMRMVVQVGLFFFLSMALTFALQALNASGIEFLQKIGLDYVWLRTGWRHVFQWTGLILPFLLSTAMFFQLIYFNPKPRPPRRSAFLGALVTAVLWEVAKVGFAVYVAKVGRFGGVGIAAGTFGFVIAMVFWAYYSGIVLILGALVTLLHETRYRARPMQRPAPEEVATEERPFPAAPEAAERRSGEEVAHR
ncbi:YihY/virulence factor BrkB family protein [Rhodocaloribacter sp.]